MSNFFSARAVWVAGFVVVVSFLVMGCDPASPASNVESGARKVVVFDGGEVTEGQVQDAVDHLSAASTAMSGGQKQDVKPGSPQFEAAKRQVMPQLIAFSLAEAYAQENGIQVSEQEVQDKIDQTKEEISQRAQEAGKGGDPGELFQDALSKFGYTEASFRDEIRRTLLVQKVEDAAVGDVKPTEQEVSDFYEKNKAQFTIPEQRCIRHILFASDEEQKAEDVKQQLEDGGDFAQLAKENSEDPGSKDQGGDLGCQAKGGFTPDFEDAAFNAKEGEIVGPVKTEFGYHLIQVTDIQPEKEQSLEEIAPDIEQRLSQQRQDNAFGAWIQDQLDQRNVKYLPAYNPKPAGSPGAGPEGAIPQGETPPGSG